MRSTACLLALAATLVATAGPLAADPPHYEAVRVLEAHATRARAVAFDDTGRWLVSGGSDRRLRVWDTATWTARASWSAPRQGERDP
ncbi:MAG: hypothetical protein AB7T63_03160 [Planctomycetota bacterium]